MDERLQFVRDAQRDRFTMSELYARYGVCRRAGYNGSRSRRGRAVRGSATGAMSCIIARTSSSRRLHHWPAASTVADLLARRGLVQRRHPRRKPVHPGVVRPVTEVANDLWTADFKGQFRTGDGRYCYPLKLADQHTRYLLACRGLLSTQPVTAKPIVKRAFREFGLPLAIRTDNGVPFAT